MSDCNHVPTTCFVVVNASACSSVGTIAHPVIIFLGRSNVMVLLRSVSKELEFAKAKKNLQTDVIKFIL